MGGDGVGEGCRSKENRGETESDKDGYVDRQKI